MTETVPGLSPLVGRYDALFLDLWGTLYDGTDFYPGVPAALAELSRRSIPFFLVTNSSRPAFRLAAFLRETSVPPAVFSGILTAGDIVRAELASRCDPFFARLGEALYYIGPPRGTPLFEDLPYRQVNDLEAASFILLSGPWRAEDSEDMYLPLFRRAVARDLPLVCANPDRQAPSGGRMNLCAGTLAAVYESLGGRVARRGKPDPALCAYCLEALPGVRPDRVAVIGDSMETDVRMADRAGVDSWLVTTGMHARQLQPEDKEKAPDPLRVQELARHHGVFPTGALTSFCW